MIKYVVRTHNTLHSSPTVTSKNSILHMVHDVSCTQSGSWKTLNGCLHCYKLHNLDQIGVVKVLSNVFLPVMHVFIEGIRFYNHNYDFCFYKKVLEEEKVASQGCEKL